MAGPIAGNWMETCEEAARAGAAELMAWRGRFQTREKGPADLVTDADLASQAAIRACLAARFPDYRFVGEEQSADRESLINEQLTWVVDPLDGTTNYVHGYPFFSVSVALARGRELLAGAIYDPIADECYLAERGRGAWLGGERLRTSEVTTIGESLLAVSLPAPVRADSPDLTDFVRVAPHAQAIRRSGSAALNLAYVAHGRLDAFWANQIHPWDVAAGVLLVTEAGGIVTDRRGAEFDLWNPRFLASANRTLHRALLGVLQPFPQD